MAKALEIRPLIERIVQKSKRLANQDNMYLQKTLRTKEAIVKCKEVIGPRFAEHQAGFTRVKFVGYRRKNDAAKMATIELLGTERRQKRDNDIQVEREAFEVPTTWDWQAKHLEEEVAYWKDLLREFKADIDDKTAAKVTQLKAKAAKSTTKEIKESEINPQQIRQKVENKFAERKSFLLFAYKRAKHEEDIHYKQRSYVKFEKIFERYGLPLGQYEMSEKDQRVHDQAKAAYE